MIPCRTLDRVKSVVVAGVLTAAIVALASCGSAAGEESGSEVPISSGVTNPSENKEFEESGSGGESGSINVESALEGEIGPTTLTIDGNQNEVYAGYSVVFSAISNGPSSPDEEPATKLGETNVTPIFTGTVTVENTTPGREYPISDASAVHVYGWWSADSPICKFAQSFSLHNGCVLRLALAQFYDGGESAERVILPVSGSLSADLSPWLILQVPDSSVAEVKSALQTPEAVAFAWAYGDATENTSPVNEACIMDSDVVSWGSLGGDLIVFGTLPQGEEGRFCLS